MLHIELLRDQGIAMLTPEGKLAASDFKRVGREIDPYIETHGNGVVIHAKGFPGWADFGALIEHIQFIKSHPRKVRRIAAVSDGEFFKIARAIAKHFVAAEIRQIPFDEMERAR